jgi:hypothetical protein
MLSSPGSTYDFGSDREEAGLPPNNSISSSSQLGTPRERKGGKFITRSRSLPVDPEKSGLNDESSESSAYVEEKPAAELFLVG